jgi:putative ABC transport system permease protein
MNEFFGIPMNAVLVTLLVLLAGVLATVGWVRWRQPILFSIGLRNIPRRRAQSVLIVLGLMLSTVIFGAALSVGDTVTYSITEDTFEKLGHVDQIVQVRSNTRQPTFDEEQISPIGVLSQREVATLIADFNGSQTVDGLLPGIRFPAPVTNMSLQTTEPVAVVMGLDPNRMRGFEQDVVLTNGMPFDIGQLRRAEVLVNQSLARRLNIVPGDRLDVWIDALPRTVRVVGVVRDRFLTGWTLAEPEGLVINLQEALFLFDIPAGIDASQVNPSFVAVSNTGGVRDGLELSDKVTQELIDSLRTSRVQVVSIKADRIEQAERTGANLTAIFIVLGLFTIAAGVLLIFLILLMLAAERRSEMGMSRAVGMKQTQLIQSFMAEGMAYSLLSALAGAALGMALSLAMTQAMQYIFSSADVQITFHIEPRSLAIAYALGVIVTYGTVLVSAWRVSRLSIVAAIRDVNEPPPRATGRLSAVVGGGAALAGILLLVLGLGTGEGYQVGTGASLLLLGGAFVARALGLPERPVFTTASLGVLVLWVLVAGDTLSAVTGSLDSGLTTFFIGGVLMVAAATLAIVYNAELLLGTLRGVGIVFTRAVPAVRTAIAYPLANKLRTGMTIAMLSLVVFALVMISTMSLNFRELFLNDEARGGWDIEVTSLQTNSFPPNQDNPLGPLGEALDRGPASCVPACPYETRRVESISEIVAPNPRRTELRQLDESGEPMRASAFPIFGADDIFLNENSIRLQARASGYTSDRAVWDAVRDDATLAVLDGSVVPGINYADVTRGRFTLDGYRSGESKFEPFSVLLTDTVTGEETTVRVVGIMERGPSETYRGLWINRAGMTATFPIQETKYFVRLQPGFNAEAEASEMQERLAEYGVAAVSIERELADAQALSTAFFLLIQGFLAIGLGVGLVALAVIAFRTVVERRQQIGLLRAIGFTRSNIGLSFVLESAFIAVLGIFNGIWPALLLSNRMLASDQFASAGFQTFHVPWLHIVLMALGVFAASVLTTVIPSQQASRIPPAEALRYE